jgi:hypothetical protein
VQGPVEKRSIEATMQTWEFDKVFTLAKGESVEIGADNGSNRRTYIVRYPNGDARLCGDLVKIFDEALDKRVNDRFARPILID